MRTVRAGEGNFEDSPACFPNVVLKNPSGASILGRPAAPTSASPPACSAARLARRARVELLFLLGRRTSLEAGHRPRSNACISFGRNMAKTCRETRATVCEGNSLHTATGDSCYAESSAESSAGGQFGQVWLSLTVWPSLAFPRNLAKFGLCVCLAARGLSENVPL